MYQDKIYEDALRAKKENEFSNLQGEVKTVEKLINRLLTQLLECSASISERDFNVCGV